MKTKEWLEGPYPERKKIVKTLGKKAGARYFRFDDLRHFGASMPDKARVPIGPNQHLLGHENNCTTEICLHSIGEAERETMTVFDREIEKNSHTQSHTEKEKDSTEVASAHPEMGFF